MGGDHGLPVTLPACIDSLSQFPNLKLILVGKEEAIQGQLKSYNYDSDRLTVHHASEEVAMDESPSHAVRNKKDSSMRVALNLVKEGRAHACVSAGNTGALMVTARFVLKTLSGIDRPAIISALPTEVPEKCVRMLDLGANVDASAENLVQFAVMGSVLANTIGQIENPSVYLLNIGEEEIKGNEQVKQTAQLLEQSHLVNYAGFIEGDRIMSGQADVVVCDGFVGNVALKSIEGTAKLIVKLMRQAFMRNAWTKMVGLMAKPIFKAFSKRIDPTSYNGATLVGLNGIVIKSHGSANQKAFTNAIQQALIQAERNITVRIKDKIAELLNPNSSSSES